MDVIAATEMHVN